MADDNQAKGPKTFAKRKPAPAAADTASPINAAAPLVPVQAIAPFKAESPIQAPVAKAPIKKAQAVKRGRVGEPSPARGKAALPGIPTSPLRPAVVETVAPPAAEPVTPTAAETIAPATIEIIAAAAKAALVSPPEDIAPAVAAATPPASFKPEPATPEITDPAPAEIAGHAEPSVAAPQAIASSLPVKPTLSANLIPAPVGAPESPPPVADDLTEPASPIADTKPLSPLSLFTHFQENFAVTTPSFDFAAAFKTAYSDAQEKAKAAYEKGTVAVGDANEFAKGNVEALVESTKILASGLQELTTELVAESREAFETLTAEAKTLAAVKSPADFFKLQSEILRRQLDALLANGTKHSEAFLKLASDAAAPLSNRVSLAVEKVKTTA